MSSVAKGTVLITGCSDGGLGAALAVAFHSRSYRVFATARNLSKTTSLKSIGIEVLTLDVLSSTSIAECVSQIGKLTNGSLDILVNNAGGGYGMPVADASIPEAKKLFDINVWSYLEVTQAFLPLLRKSESAMIVNNTSVASVCAVPFEGIYCGSKAAAAMIFDTLRLELLPFGIKVVELKTAAVKSNIHENSTKRVGEGASLPSNSIYAIAREKVEAVMHGEGHNEMGMPANEWADAVVRDLSVKSPRAQIWHGARSWAMWMSTCLPHGTLDGMLKKIRGLNDVERRLLESKN